MSRYVAALPMYDWPERTEEVDAQWATIRDRLRAAGVDAPEQLARCNGDIPAVPGGIRDRRGEVIAPDPATLPSHEFHFPTLWRHPDLLFAQACWGPMELGLADDVQVVGQPDYSGIEGGQGEFYSSALVMRCGEAAPAPADGCAAIPLAVLRGKRLAYNSLDSMSGIMALTRDLAGMGEGLDTFSDRIESGGHRNSIIAVAESRADVAAVDCMSWALAQRFEPAARDLVVVGWTSRRKGLPYIASKRIPDIDPMRSAVRG
ncbi:phosphate/phosphite/phosphonate ABC transporter substrate-binding protein [Arvimicrobium flavum]|uniref:phosphate/phosphite/phosphonate ABC transporter substrate-binding protein n=1 Tax=Arvimicrobium flavum TaxID=3393320 RepID=UPI00237B2295|nr:PhnD/SsuA/transferrin family substrate-binding protein [Mesorhizobium shangrilense]